MAQDDENVVILEEAEFEQDEETAPLEEQDGGDSEYMVSLDELEPVAPEQPAEVQEVGKKSKKKAFCHRRGGGRFSAHLNGNFVFGF